MNEYEIKKAKALLNACESVERFETSPYNCGCERGQALTAHYAGESDHEIFYSLNEVIRYCAKIING